MFRRKLTALEYHNPAGFDCTGRKSLAPEPPGPGEVTWSRLTRSTVPSPRGRLRGEGAEKHRRWRNTGGETRSTPPSSRLFRDKTFNKPRFRSSKLIPTLDGRVVPLVFGITLRQISSHFSFNPETISPAPSVYHNDSGCKYPNVTDKALR